VKLRALALTALVASCGGEDRRVDQGAALGGDVALRAGSEVVPLSLVGNVARTQKIEVREAVRRLSDDAVAADAAKKKGLDRADPAAWQLEAARARFVADRLLTDARAKGPPTDDEVKESSKQHWREVDRPPAARVAHALAMPKKKGDPKQDADAKEVARSIAEAVRGSASETDFMERAKAVPHPDDVSIVAESLPAVTAEGDLLDMQGGMDPAFARAANRLEKPGDISPIVESDKYGWHILYLNEKVPEQRMAFEDRRVAFASEIYARRSNAALQAVLEAGRRKTKIEILPSAEGVMRTVSVETQATKNAANAP
jgi:hypothetical protein